MERIVIPTVFAQSKEEFDERFSRIVSVAKYIQIDFMDGKFVKTKGIRIEDVPDLRKYRVRFEAHLMVNRPERYLDNLKKKGFRKVIFHYEVLKDLDRIKRLIFEIKKRKIEAWIALNPSTHIEKIESILERIDGVLFMGVHPGREGQKFVDKVYKNIRKVKKIHKRTKIQVDGGVNLLNIGKLGKLKVNYVNSGSFIYLADDPKRTLGILERAFR